MHQMTATLRPRAGRPTREQAEARHAELLDRALDHFLEKGFEQATIEAIAQDVGMTKRTVYARHRDKVSLFRAAVSLAIERYLVTDEQLAATASEDFAETLTRLAWLRVSQVMTPNGLRLQRIINTESYRFPDIFNEAYERGALPTIRHMAALFERESKRGVLALAEPEKAATTFMSMVVGGPVRILVSGNTMTRQELDDRIGFAVKLFLDGARAR